MVNRRPELEIVAPSASPREAAGVAAALEQFMRDTAPVRAAGARIPRWARAGRLEAAGLDPANRSPWGQNEGWRSE